MRITRIQFSVINVAVKRPLTNYEILQEFWKSRFGDLFLFTISDVQINIEDFARHNNAEGISVLLLEPHSGPLCREKQAEDKQHML